MSNKLVKSNNISNEVENKKIVKLSIKDILFMILITSAIVLKQMYVVIPEFIVLDRTLDIMLMVAGIVGCLAIAVACGSYQNKQQNDKITVASVLRGDNKVEYTFLEKLINWTNGLLRTVNIALVSCLPNKSVGIVLMLVSAVAIVIVTPKNKFKLMDIFYTVYTVGMLAVIYYMVNT